MCEYQGKAVGTLNANSDRTWYWNGSYGCGWITRPSASFFTLRISM